MTDPRPTAPTNQFSGLPLPRLVALRSRYVSLLATTPAAWGYATAALAELDGLIAATAAGTGVAA